MATVNLGAIKFNWKGAYSNSTAYAVDDVVSSGGSSYVCIQAHTNQPVGNATAYWNIMSSAGTNGTDGTDLTTTLTTRGDIVYKGASALTRLPKGTAGYYLKQGANDPEWGEVSAGGLSHIATTVVGSATGYVNFNNCFTADYDVYRCHWSNFYNHSTSGERLVSYLMDTNGNNITSGGYETIHGLAYANGGTDGAGSGRDWGVSYITHTNADVHTGTASAGYCDIFNPRDGSNRVVYSGHSFYHNGTYHYSDTYSGTLANNVEIFGINFTVTGGSIKADSTFSVYGYKKS
jgi:hypothetical protein